MSGQRESCQSQETLAGGIDIRSSESSILLVIALDSAQPDDLRESILLPQSSQLFTDPVAGACGASASRQMRAESESADRIELD